MPDFEEALLRLAGPRLRRLGYDYEPRLRVGDELFGFHKSLGADIHAIIQFHRRHAGLQDDFTISLISAKSEEIQPRMYGGYDGARGARLSEVLWFVHHLRDLPVPDYWWATPDETCLETALNEALTYLEHYGVQWLEAPAPLKPWEMPAHHLMEFADGVEAVVAPEMERRGYQLEQCGLAGGLPYLYFCKLLPDNTYASIEMQPIYSLDPDRFYFDIRLQRRPNRHPLALENLAPRFPSASLAQLAWRAHGGSPLSQATITEIGSLFWVYRDLENLDAQLHAAVQDIVQIGLPWVEHLMSHQDDTIP